MRRIVAYFFFIILTLHTFSQIIVVGKFLYNQDFIAANLCENIDKPELKCNGKCHLKKELKKDTEEHHSDKVLTSETILFFQEDKIVITLDEPCYYVKKENFTHYVGEDLSDFHPSVFHPPC